jgi:L-lactate dehydrogenase complex protein LldE
MSIQNEKRKVGVFVSCHVDQFAPQTANNMMKLLVSQGVECHYPTEQTCCGRDLYMNGDRDGAKHLGEKMIELFAEDDYVVSCSSGCVAYMKKNFERLFHNTTYHNQHGKMVSKLMDITDYLVNVIDYHPVGFVFPHRVAFLDHCTSMRDYGLHDAPRQLLRSVQGLELVEMPQTEVCCGQGSLFANNFSPIAADLAHRKVQNALDVGAEYLVSTESSCLLHLQAYCDMHELPLKCIHIVDLLAMDVR